MRIFGLFDKYFLILMLIQCSILILYDGGIFKRKQDSLSFKQSRSIGILLIVITIVLYIISRFA